MLYALLASFVCSCGLYGKFKEPVTDSSDVFGDIAVTENDIQLPSWEDVFTDPSLQKLIDSALVHNTDLKVSVLRIEQAKAALTNARLSFLPSAELNIGGASAFWEIDLFGNLLNNARAAGESLKGSEAYSQSVRSTLIASVAATYCTLQMLDRQIEIGQNSLENWIQTEKTLESLKKFDNSVNEAALLQAKAQRLALEGSLLSLQQSLAETENEMCTLLAIAPSHIERSDIGAISLPQSLCDSIPFRLVAGRPDVQAALHQYAQAFYLTNRARSSFFPSISISGTTTWEFAAEAFLSAAQPIFKNGKNISALKSAKAEQEIAGLNYRQTLLDAGKDVSNSLSAINTAQQRYEKDILQVEALQEAVRKTELLMQHSSVNYLEVLTARQSLLSAEQALAEDSYSELCGLISLFCALGGGA